MKPYGKTPDGKAVEMYTLHTLKGAEARIIITAASSFP